jgi:hypothetical protein
MDALLAAKCHPLLDRFLAHDLDKSPISDISSEEGGYFNVPRTRTFEIYIPPPPTAERGQTFLYHMATRNFFAWVFGKSLVGTHLGGALVGVLNSMIEFRSSGVDSVQDILDYMDEEGYADMRDSPNHALAVLFFAEHFRFKDLWIEAFAHCTGMHERLAVSPGFEVCGGHVRQGRQLADIYQFMSRTSRALITRSKVEMDLRLQNAGQMLGSFLSDDLSEAHLGLTSGARSHLDKFRSFLQSYYVAKLGYYPPSSAAFSKNIYAQMCTEFQMLYDLIVDTQFSTADNIPSCQQGGICVFQSVQAFDARHKYTSLPHPLPLLPDVDDTPSSDKDRLRKRLSFHSKVDKMKPNPRLVALSSLNKATNRRNQALYDCSLVRAYREFENDGVLSPSKADKHDRLSQTDARKVRWILIYSILQTLLSVTRVPESVHDTGNVPYNLCVLTAGCPPWKTDCPLEMLLRTQTDQTKEDFIYTLSKPSGTTESVPCTPAEIKPDIDYFALTHKKHDSNLSAASTISPTTSRKGTVRRALSTLGNMPELRHPKPRRATFHEILVHGYGNGTNRVSITTVPSIAEDDEHHSTDSSSSSTENLSSRWSNTSTDAGGFDSPRSSLSTSRRGSDASKKSIEDFLDAPMISKGVRSVPSSVYSQSIYDDCSILQPDPLSVKKSQD